VKLRHARLVCQTRRGFAGSGLSVAALRAAPDPAKPLGLTHPRAHPSFTSSL